MIESEQRLPVIEGERADGGIGFGRPDQHGLMLMHRAMRFETKPDVKGKAILRRIEHHPPVPGPRQQRLHQQAADALPPGLWRDDDHADRGAVIAIRPPQRRAQQLALTLDNQPLAKAERESPVFEAIGPLQRAGQAMCLFQMIGAHGRHLWSGLRAVIDREMNHGARPQKYLSQAMSRRRFLSREYQAVGI
jgi:hypothetical protein